MAGETRLPDGTVTIDDEGRVVLTITDEKLPFEGVVTLDRANALALARFILLHLAEDAGAAQ